MSGSQLSPSSEDHSVNKPEDEDHHHDEKSPLLLHWYKKEQKEQKEAEDEFNFEAQDVTPTLAQFEKLTLRERTYQTFENPQFSRLAWVLNMYVLFMIVFSTLTFCLESVYSLNDTERKEHIWFVLETFVIINFSLDYAIRLLTCPNVRSFVVQPLNIIDLIAILPYYISLALPEEGGIAGLAVVRVLRLVRIFRILKIGKTTEVVRLIGVAFTRSKEAIFVLLFMITLAMIFFSSFIFYAETSICELDRELGKWVYTSGIKEGEETYYQNIVASFWWSLVTLTTVGYGDTYPVSGIGKFVASVTMISGILVLAFPITIIGTHLTDTYNEFRGEKEIKQRKDLKVVDTKTFDGKSYEELVLLLETYQQKITDLGDTIHQKVREVNIHMEEMDKFQQNADLLVTFMKNNLDKL